MTPDPRLRSRCERGCICGPDWLPKNCRKNGSLKNGESSPRFFTTFEVLIFTTAGSAGFKIEANPLGKLPSKTGFASCDTVTAREGAPNTVWPPQCLRAT